VNRNDYIMLTGDMNARVGNNRVINIVGTNREATLNNNGRKLIDFCTFNNLRIVTFVIIINHFQINHKPLTCSPWVKIKINIVRCNELSSCFFRFEGKTGKFRALSDHTSTVFSLFVLVSDKITHSQ
jgi:hypothetical protein